MFKKPFYTITGELTGKKLAELIERHKMIKPQYERAIKYYEGDHDILYKTMADKSKPNNKIVVNLPQFTTDIRTGYFSGEPLTFTTSEGNETHLQAIKDIFEYNDLQEVNAELDLLSSIYGHSYLILYVDEMGLTRFASEDPINTFIIHSNTVEKKPLFAVRYYEDEKTHEITALVYTEREIITYIIDGTGAQIIEPLDQKEKINYFGIVPIIEFVENGTRKGAYYDSISIVDSIEKILSSQANEIEYFDNAYLHLKNLSGTTSEDIQEMKANRVILTDDDGQAEFITKQINDAHIMNMVKELTDNYHKITKTPNLTDESFASNASGVALKFKLFGMEKDLSKKECKWRKSLQAAIEGITNKLNIVGNSFTYTDIKIHFTRALPSNLIEQADIINKLKGIVSDKTLLATLDIVEDAEAEIEALKAQKEEAFNIYSMPPITQQGAENEQ